MTIKNSLKVDLLEHRKLLAIGDMEDFGSEEAAEDSSSCSAEVLQKAELWDAYIKTLIEPWDIIPAGTSFTFKDPVPLWLKQDGHLKAEFEWIFETFDFNDEKVDEFDFWTKCEFRLLDPFVSFGADAAGADATAAETEMIPGETAEEAAEMITEEPVAAVLEATEEEAAAFVESTEAPEEEILAVEEVEEEFPIIEDWDQLHEALDALLGFATEDPITTENMTEEVTVEDHIATEVIAEEADVILAEEAALEEDSVAVEVATEEVAVEVAA